MPRAEVGTPKYLANKMKSKGLQRLRWYCQVCQKQCRDENGFKCHAQSEGHLRQMLVVGENAGRHIADFSGQFQHDFVQLLSRRFGTKRVFANRVYQEFIQDKSHLHMNATRWVTLTEFVKHLGRSSIARVDETDKGWFIAWIDNSPKALAKQEASLKKERATMSDEQRERILIAEQIERAQQEAGTSSGSASPPPEERGLQRDESADKVVLSLSMKPSAPAESTPAPATGGLKLNPLKPGVNPLKRPNVFKTSAVSKPSDRADTSNDKKRPAAAMSAAERLILEDQERKRRRMEREGVS
ncbi:domain of Kin17 curved DNA-binding protein-domain-containing protein [Boletus edulis BED1]|uniref:Domain of Kin17 curved DNA-binding protein-domain-containing protein n=1 Tax=Boletus edulis BED1 TaxID=1328754 RepID=A0AAD4GGB1_BOLED|nr:domain of Kin17 curved DNA-binding protein-domain-containing protein [Boletus edulis BED1]